MSTSSLAKNLGGHRELLSDSLPGENLPWLNEARERAYNRLRNRGLPTVRDEEWRYTDLKKLHEQVFAVPSLTEEASTRAHIADSGLTDQPSVRLVFVNGLLADACAEADLPEGVFLGSLAQGMVTRPDDIKACLGAALPDEPHGFICANTAFFRDGALLIIEQDVQLKSPIELVFITTTLSQIVAHPRNLIICDQGSSATVIERYISDSGQACLNNPISEIFLASNASLDHYRIQSEQEAGFHIGGVYISQQRDSLVNSNNICLGGLLARTDLNGTLSEPGARLNMNGLVIGNNRQHVDNCTEVRHAAPSCESDEYYKSILDDRSRSVFRGRVVVEQDAQKTSADQQSKNLLLSEKSEADIKPQLEIYADDVKCSHGATVGQLDEKSVFYLRSRGIDEASARSLLTFAFANDIVERMALAGIRNELSTLIADRLFPGLARETLS